MLAPANVLDPATLQARLDGRLARSLQPLAWALCGAFAFFTLITLAFQPAGATIPLSILDGAGAALTGVLALALRRWESPPRAAHAVAALVLLPAFVASLAALKLLHLPVLSTNLMLVMIAAASIFLNLRWTLVVFVAALALWAPIAWSEGFDERWLNAGFALGATAITGTAIQMSRLRYARETEHLLEANARKTRELEAAAQKQFEANAELRHINENLEAFTYVVGHDLKEPVRALDMFLSEAEGPAEANERAEAIARARQQLTHLDRLLRGLLDWARSTPGAYAGQPIAIADVLTDPAVQVQYRGLLDERRATLVIADGLPTVVASTPVLGQILGNLIVNAIKHNPKASPTVRILPGPPTGRALAEIIVEDDGPGFPDAVKDSVRGWREKPMTIRGGFGLAITKRAMQRLGGELILSDAPGGGGRAHLILPVPEVPGPRAVALERIPERV